MATFQCLSIHPISPICLTHHPSLSAQSAPSPPLLTLPYLPNQPYHPHSSPSPICPISPITPTPHPSLSTQSAPSPPTHHPPLSCPISPICLTPHPPLSTQLAPSPSLITLLYLPNQPHLPHSSPFPIPQTSKLFSTTYPFVVFSSYSSLHKPSPLVA